MTDTIITTEDSVNINERTNLNNITKDMKSKFNIKNDIKFDRLKSLERDWLKPIFKLAFKNDLKFVVKETNFLLNLVFEDENDLKEFEKHFKSNFHKAINSFLTNKGLIPQKYNRIVSFESSQDKLLLTYSF